MPVGHSSYDPPLLHPRGSPWRLRAVRAAIWQTAMAAVALVLLTSPASAQNGTDSTTDPFDCKADALEMHNWLRGIHQAPNLTWSDALASAAHDWANNLAGKGCSNDVSNVPENVVSFSPEEISQTPCFEAVAKWYMNGARWNFTKTPVSDNKDGLTQSQGFELAGTIPARPFTQVVWVSNRQVGCAATTGPSGCISVVCRYTVGVSAAGALIAGQPVGVTDDVLLTNVKAPVVPVELVANQSSNQDVLAVFNKHRKAHQAPPLVWDEQLAIGAQSWAKALEHTRCTKGKRIGRPQGETDIYGSIATDRGGAEYDYGIAVVWYNFTSTPWTDNKNQFSKVRPFVNMVLKANNKVGCGSVSGPYCREFHCWFGDFDLTTLDDSSMRANVQPMLPPVYTSAQQAQHNKAVALINTHRADHGAPPLTWNDQYAAAMEALVLSDPTSNFDNLANTTKTVGGSPPGILMFATYLTNITNETVYDTAIDSWYSGAYTYQFTTTPFTDNLQHDTNQTLMSFSQLVWVASNQVGCASVYEKIAKRWWAMCKFGSTINTPLDSEYLKNVLMLGGHQVALPSSNTDTSQPDGSSSSSSHSTTGIIAGVCVGVGMALIAAILGVWWYRHRQQKRQQQEDDVWASFKSPSKTVLQAGMTNMTTASGVTASTQNHNSNLMGPTSFTQHSGQGVTNVMALPGLMTGEAFTRATAFAYSWTECQSDAGATQAVEAGLNDAQLDNLVQGSGGTVQEPPVVSLSKEQVQQQLQLITSGLLGRGGAALVFKALWPSRFGPDALLAVKVLKDGYDSNPYVLQSFAHEASVLSAVRHPNVVRLYGYCLEPPTVCLIMELLPGSLKNVLYHTPGAITNTTTSAYNTGMSLPTSNHSNSMPPGEGPANVPTVSASIQQPDSKSSAVPLTMSQVLKYSTDIAAGLAYLHEQPEQPITLAEGMPAPAPLETLAEADSAELERTNNQSTSTKIVHRDLKPANILINSSDVAKITDFGLARRHDNTTIDTRHVGAGTVPYQAPEVLSGAQAGAYGLKATNRCDIYSMAMIMWELIARQPPWSGMNEMSILGAVVHGRRPELPATKRKSVTGETDMLDLSQLPASLTALPAFNDIIRQCWAQREMRRPTAGELRGMLAGLQQRYGATATTSASVEVRVIDGEAAN